MALIRWFGLKDTAHNRAASRILMLSAVKRGLHPGSKVDTIVVFVGPQGVGKSSGIIAIFGEEFVAQGLSQLGTKDALIEMMEPWVIELAELDALSRREHATIKAVLTRTEDILRLPYERVTTRSPRGCVFVGTTNEAVPLQDPTGGRRFIMVDVKRANIKRIHAERDAVFGEAVQRLSEGEPWHPTVEEEALFAEARESKYAGDPWEDDVAEALESLERRELLRNHVPTRVILNELPHPANGHTRADELRLGKVMPRLGYESVRLPASIHPRRPRGWFKDIGKPGISEARPSNIATLMEDL